MQKGSSRKALSCSTLQLPGVSTSPSEQSVRRSSADGARRNLQGSGLSAHEFENTENSDSSSCGEDETARKTTALTAGVHEVYELVNDAGSCRLDQFLSERLPKYSRSYLQKLIEEGYVRVPAIQRDVKSSTRVPPGASVHCTVPPPRKPDLSPQEIPLEIVFEDEHVAIINKPAGLTVHPAPSQVGHTLVNALLYWLKDLSGIGGEERPGIVHRLDKETSGVLVVAKHDFSHRALALQFKERKVYKTYLAISRGDPKRWDGRIDYAIGRSYTHTKKQMVRTDGTGREAITDYRVLEKFRGYSLLELYPKTGRTHQIRVHLCNESLPIVCDKLYGSEKRVFLSELRGTPKQKNEKPLLDRHALHAASISFLHPLTREEMAFSAGFPEDMHGLLKALETHRSRRRDG